MTTYPLDKLNYFLFQDSASKVSYACERIILWIWRWIWIWTKWQISVLGDIHILLSFYWILTGGPIIIVKKNLYTCTPVEGRIIKLWCNNKVSWFVTYQKSRISRNCHRFWRSEQPYSRMATQVTPSPVV